MASAGARDAKYEFAAPQYVNFSEATVDAPDAVVEAWFEKEENVAALRSPELAGASGGGAPSFAFVSPARGAPPAGSRTPAGKTPGGAEPPRSAGRKAPKPSTPLARMVRPDSAKKAPAPPGTPPAKSDAAAAAAPDTAAGPKTPLRPSSEASPPPSVILLPGSWSTADNAIEDAPSPVPAPAEPFRGSQLVSSAAPSEAAGAAASSAAGTDDSAVRSSAATAATSAIRATAWDVSLPKPTTAAAKKPAGAPPRLDGAPRVAYVRPASAVAAAAKPAAPKPARPASASARPAPNAAAAATASKPPAPAVVRPSSAPARPKTAPAVSRPAAARPVAAAAGARGRGGPAAAAAAGAKPSFEEAIRKTNEGLAMLAQLRGVPRDDAFAALAATSGHGPGDENRAPPAGGHLAPPQPSAEPTLPKDGAARTRYLELTKARALKLAPSAGGTSSVDRPLSDLLRKSGASAGSGGHQHQHHQLNHHTTFGGTGVRPAPAGPPKPFEPTVGVAPHFAVDDRAKPPADPRTTEEIQLARSKAEAEAEVARRHAQNERARLLLRKPMEVLPARSTKPLTEPAEFHFAPPSARAAALRRSASAAELAGAEPYVPLAVAAGNFSSTLKSARDPLGRVHESLEGSRSARSVLSAGGMQPTQPAAPLLHTTLRARPPTDLLSSEERVLADFAAQPKFRARPVDRRVLESCGDLGVPRIVKIAATVPMDIHFHTDDRLAARPDAEAAAGAAAYRECTFRPALHTLNRAILEGPDFVAVHVDSVPTVPVPPRLMTDVRGAAAAAVLAAEEASRRAQEEADRARHAFRALPVPDDAFAAPLPAVPKRPLTAPAPFELRTGARGAFSGVKLQAKLQAEAAAQAAQKVKARGISPAVYRPFVPIIEERVIEATPFELESVRRHDAAVREMSAQHAAEAAAAREATNFRARPNVSAVQEPFIPKRAPHMPTAFAEFNFLSEARLEERRAFEAERADRERAEAAERAAREAEAAAAAAADVKALRRSMEFKARPPPNFANPFVPRVSEAQLTYPRGPHLHTETRSSRPGSVAFSMA